VFFIPVFYFFQGLDPTHPVIVGSASYCVAISAFCEFPSSKRRTSRNIYTLVGFLKWYSRLYRNQGSLLLAPSKFDWSEQIVVITGGALAVWSKGVWVSDRMLGSSGVGELLANTLAVKNVTVVVLDVNPIQTENCMCH
jgi:hypothetical protein